MIIFKRYNNNGSWLFTIKWLFFLNYNSDGFYKRYKNKVKFIHYNWGFINLSKHPYTEPNWWIW